MMHGYGACSVIAASLETMRSVWSLNAVVGAQPVCWRAEGMDTPWASSDANMVRARRARQPAREAAAVLAVVDIGDAESHSSASRMRHKSERRNCVVVHVVCSAQHRSIIDLTSTGTVRVPGTDKE